MNTRLWMVSFILSVLGISDGRACSVCMLPGENGLTMPHPRALAVAVATAAAAERGELVDNGNLSKMPPGVIIRLWMLKHRPFASGSTHILLIDADLRSSVQFASDGMKIIPNADGPSDRQVVTTERTLRALVQGSLSMEEATKKELLILQMERAF